MAAKKHVELPKKKNKKKNQKKRKKEKEAHIFSETDWPKRYSNWAVPNTIFYSHFKVIDKYRFYLDEAWVILS